MDEPFSVALRLSLEIAESGEGSLKGPGWRDRLRPIGARELGSKVWPDGSRPSRDDADGMVGRTLTNHSLGNLNTDRRANLSKAPHAVIIAEIVLRPELAPIPPGGEFPDVTDEVLSEPIPFHATVWPYGANSVEERETAAELLQQVVSGVPLELWRRDG